MIASILACVDIQIVHVFIRLFDITLWFKSIEKSLYYTVNKGYS